MKYTSTDIINTDFIILRKTPFSNASLVLAGLSPDVGQIHFLVKGGRRLGKKQFPVADIFRVVHVRFREGRSDLKQWLSVDPVTEYPLLSRDLTALRLAAGMARFALANVLYGMKIPQSYRALNTCLDLVGNAAENSAVSTELQCAAFTGVCLTYLSENGLLLEQKRDQRAARQCEAIVRAALGDADFPHLTQKCWQRIHDWVIAQLIRTECQVPECFMKGPDHSNAP